MSAHRNNLFCLFVPFIAIVIVDRGNPDPSLLRTKFMLLTIIIIIIIIIIITTVLDTIFKKIFATLKHFGKLITPDKMMPKKELFLKC